MAYRKGTYKLNLGLDSELKNTLDSICFSQDIRKVSDGVRFCIQYTYESLNRSVAPDDIVSVLHALREDLEKSLEVCKRFK